MTTAAFSCFVRSWRCSFSRRRRSRSSSALDRSSHRFVYCSLRAAKSDLCWTIIPWSRSWARDISALNLASCSRTFTSVHACACSPSSPAASSSLGSMNPRPNAASAASAFACTTSCCSVTSCSRKSAMTARSFDSMPSSRIICRTMRSFLDRSSISTNSGSFLRWNPQAAPVVSWYKRFSPASVCASHCRSAGTSVSVSRHWITGNG
mmetsp:Transcript_115267/g.200636  ORF Transcript_115267/g.200636 Transcript_115267/m.200636 type:complete len:208 (+) Transcript_115267:2890-3513(+)